MNNTIKRIISVVFALMLSMSVFGCAEAEIEVGSISITNQSEYMEDGQAILAQTDPADVKVRFSLKEAVAGITVVGDKVFFDNKTVADDTAFTVVAKAGDKSCEKTFKAIVDEYAEPDWRGISITNTNTTIFSGTEIRARINPSKIRPTFSLKEECPGVSIETIEQTYGKVLLSRSVIKGTKFTVVATADDLVAEKEFTVGQDGGEFYDDFSNVSSFKDNWYISNASWGGSSDGGCIPENVALSDGGELILTANGDYYTGTKSGANNTKGKRTGAAIISKDIFGPGSFEVKMKMMPRIGACNAIWTFYYEGADTNHEIDFEAPGSWRAPGEDESQYSLENTLFTNWIDTGSGNNTTYKRNDTPNNDGDWHTYRFEWHTNPKRIDWYIDDVLMCTNTLNVPTYNARLWVGVWFPSGWCGTPNFETDYMLVDYVKVTPNNETGSELGKDIYYGVAAANPAQYPTATTALPERNMFSNAGFESTVAWTLNSGGTGNTAVNKTDPANSHRGARYLEVTGTGSATQMIDSVYGGFELDLSAYIKTTGGAQILVEYLKYNNSVLSSVAVNADTAAYAKVDKHLTAPAGCKKIRITLSSPSGKAQFDTLSLKLS